VMALVSTDMGQQCHAQRPHRFQKLGTYWSSGRMGICAPDLTDATRGSTTIQSQTASNATPQADDSDEFDSDKLVSSLTMQKK
jgi:hypothetical protein